MRPFHKLDRTRHQAAPQVSERLRQAILSLELAPDAVSSRLEGLADIFAQHATLLSRIDISSAPSARQAHFRHSAIDLEVDRTQARPGAAAALPRLRDLSDTRAASRTCAPAFRPL